MTRPILVVPPHDLWEQWTGHAPLDAEDREFTFRLLATRGYPYRRIEIFKFPWNPLARSQPLLRAIDPLRALRILLLQRRAAIVLCHFESSALVLLLLRRMFLFRPKIAVLDIGITGTSRLRDRILHLVVRRADAVLPLGVNRVPEIAAEFQPAGIVAPIRGSVDCAFYAAAPDHPGGAVLAIGDDVSRDYRTLLDAAPHIQHDVVIRSRVLTRHEIDAPNVTLRSEFLVATDYRDLIAAASVIVLPLHPSRHAGGVSVLVQAMASGKAIVVTASEGIADYLDDGVTCLVVPPHDPPRLAQAVSRLLRDDALRTALGRQARDYATRSLSLEATADQLEAVFERLCLQT